ncbi:hypothetical protein HDE68_001534 [Pedobacter cryoconitis]|uniref:Glycosyl transferase family 11 n=1 Tax=Pedobacter cryoconitis TaxID=188932 RepID=A0A7W9DY85_9SPHI|nr:alpha-1,2-fucosyltransferase [Pedobacter cryoconitis]MBB5635646.1 hypothetical protein [Pedobacter cryoconitis]
MKIIRFTGGLGNQMFQYACYKALTKKFNNVTADISSYENGTVHNGYELDHIFELKINKVSPMTGGIYDIYNRKWIYKKIRKIFNLKRFQKEEQKHFTFDPDIFLSPKSRYYSGFWQNEGYFIDIADEIRKDFKFKSLTDEKNIKALEEIKQTNSVGVHIRRGDYVNHPTFGGVCEKEYYQEAIQLIKTKTDSTKFFIFSNDIDWCTENLDITNSEFISWNAGTHSYIDMQLMSACKHNIIANSSFSWWAAWLNENPDKIIIGPEKWLQGGQDDTSTVLPRDWIRI